MIPMDGAETTRSRLLEAAGREFAEKGFEGATVRGISDRAEANLAAVNYYFGGKEALYERAVVESHECGTIESPELDLVGLPPEEQLTVYIRTFLSKVVAWTRRMTGDGR